MYNFMLFSYVDLIQRIIHITTSFWTGMLFSVKTRKKTENKNVLIELLNSSIPFLPVFNVFSMHILEIFKLIMRNCPVNKLQPYTNTQKYYLRLRIMFLLFEVVKQAREKDPSVWHLQLPNNCKKEIPFFNYIPFFSYPLTGLMRLLIGHIIQTVFNHWCLNRKQKKKK